MAQRNAGPTTIRAAILRGLMRPGGYRGRRLLKQEHMGQGSHTACHDCTWSSNLEFCATWEWAPRWGDGVWFACSSTIPLPRLRRLASGQIRFALAITSFFGIGSRSSGQSAKGDMWLPTTSPIFVCTSPGLVSKHFVSMDAFQCLAF